MNTYLKSATERGEILGEKPIQPESVFDLLTPEHRNFLKEQKLKLEAKEKEKVSESEKEKKEKRYEKFVSLIKINHSGL